MKLLSAFSINMLAMPVQVSFVEVSLEEVRSLLSMGKPMESYIGHMATAEILSAKLGFAVSFNREDVVLKSGDEAIVAQLPRPREGQVYSGQEISDMAIRYVCIDVF